MPVSDIYIYIARVKPVDNRVEQVFYFSATSFHTASLICQLNVCTAYVSVFLAATIAIYIATRHRSLFNRIQEQHMHTRMYRRAKFVLHLLKTYVS